MRVLVSIVIILGVITVFYFSQKDDKDSALIKGLAQIQQLFDKGITGDRTTTVYKIKDKDGNWVYTNKPPSDDEQTGKGKKIEKLEIDPNANVVPSVLEQDKKKQ